MYERPKLESSQGVPVGEERPTSEAAPEWYEIKSTSLAQFVNVCASALDARYSRNLRCQLYAMGHSGGLTPVQWCGVTYTGPMMLDLYRRAARAAAA